MRVLCMCIDGPNFLSFSVPDLAGLASEAFAGHAVVKHEYTPGTDDKTRNIDGWISVRINALSLPPTGYVGKMHQ